MGNLLFDSLYPGRQAGHHLERQLADATTSESSIPRALAPKRLSNFWVWFFRGLIAFSFCSFVTASFGTWVLSGEPHRLRVAQEKAMSAAAPQLAGYSYGQPENFLTGFCAGQTTTEGAGSATLPLLTTGVRS